MSSVAVPSTKIRPEIQGLRAVAVGVVLVFHIWPDLLPGGYVGVDVFFVVSGFLITSLLVKEVEVSEGIHFGHFYLRRARRLLPAATLVLAFVAVGTLFLLPASLWEDTAWEILASILYVENWRLAFLSVDYLGAENPPSPVQHYWSLSIEEQFYLLWPALIFLCLVLSRRGLSFRTVLRTTFLAVLLSSLWLSITGTRADSATAYFVTHTRVWELALGGLLAVTPLTLKRWTRELAGFVGLSAIVISSIFFSGQTEFPGYSALLPTLGAALVIIGGASTIRANPASALSSRPFQFLGDISYSVYLWHWPLVVFFLAETGQRTVGFVAGWVLIGATIAAATATKVHVEDRFRRTSMSRAWGTSLAKSVAVASVPILGVMLILGRVNWDERSSGADARYPGAAAIGKDFEASDVFIPALSALKRDRPEVYSNGCHLEFDEVEPVGCELGDGGGARRVFLIGDSHAANWIPAFSRIGSTQGWDVRSYTKSSCALMPVMLRRNGKPYEECYEWGVRVRQIISREKPDLVVLAQMYSHKTIAPDGGEAPSLRGGLVDLWREIEQQGIQVVVISDTPRWKTDPDACLARDRWCSVPLDAVRNKDPLVDAQRRERRVGLVDMTDAVCPEGSCPAVIGNVVVWRDRHHLTATYSASMAEMLLERLLRAEESSAEWAGRTETTLEQTGVF